MRKLILISLIALVLITLVIAQVITTQDKKISISKEDIKILEKYGLDNYYYEDYVIKGNVSKVTVTKRCLFNKDNLKTIACFFVRNENLDDNTILERLDQKEEAYLVGIIEQDKNKFTPTTIKPIPIRNGTTTIVEK